MSLWFLAWGLIASLQVSAALAQSVRPTDLPVECGVPIAEPDGWPIAAPESVGLDGAALCALEGHYKSFTESNIHSVLLVRHGTLVYEQYFAGEDQSWGQSLGRVHFHSDTKHDLRSVTKSVTSLLIRDCNRAQAGVGHRRAGFQVLSGIR